jgi:hypothetical protein
MRVPLQLEQFAVGDFRHDAAAPETHFTICSNQLYALISAPSWRVRHGVSSSADRGCGSCDTAGNLEKLASRNFIRHASPSTHLHNSAEAGDRQTGTIARRFR